MFSWQIWITIGNRKESEYVSIVNGTNSDTAVVSLRNNMHPEVVVLDAILYKLSRLYKKLMVLFKNFHSADLVNPFLACRLSVLDSGTSTRVYLYIVLSCSMQYIFCSILLQRFPELPFKRSQEIGLFVVNLQRSQQKRRAIHRWII